MGRSEHDGDHARSPTATAPPTSDDESIGELQTLWRTLGVPHSALELASDGTLPLRTAPPDIAAAGDRLPTVDSLPTLRVAAVQTSERTGRQLQLGEVLGEGGMGVVHAATQLALGREVAVKIARDGSGDPRAAVELLREARVIGSLQHPNIIPIHDLGRDERGQPLFVMKRIEGVVWSEFIADPHRHTRGGDSRDALEFHLDVLMDVCRAVHLAHSKGIVHRDLKPANVMIGSFGEVYVLDWGLAVGLEDDLAGNLRLAREVREVCGTPAYMAPEMAVGDGRKIDVRTDVYLLGAILHECVTGAPRHTGNTAAEILLSVYRSEPCVYDSSVPEEIGQICNRATAADPDERFSSAEQLRLALAAFVRHRSSNALAQQAVVRAEQLRELLASEPSEPPDALDQQAHRLLVECRFAAEQARQSWPENPDVQAPLQRALELMIERALDQRDHRAAATLLAEIESPPAELVDRVDRLEKRLQAERERLERLEQLERDQDIDVGRRKRVSFMVAIACLFAFVPLAAGQAMRRGLFHPTHALMSLELVLFALMIELFLLFARRSMRATEINRRIGAALRVLYVALFVLAVSGTLLELTPSKVAILVMLLTALFVGTLAATLDRRLFGAALIFFSGYLAAAAAPGVWTEVLGITNLLGTLAVAAAWKGARNQPPSPPPE